MKRLIAKSVIAVFVVVLASLFITSLWIDHVATAEAASTVQKLQPTHGGILLVSEARDVLWFYPPKQATGSATNRQIAPAIETLFRTDPTGKPGPWLATGFKEDARNKTITLTLRKGVKFHDGTAFNAEAAAWNLTQSMVNHVSGTEKFESVTASDEYTVRIKLSSWDSTAISCLSLNAGMIVSPAAYKKNGEEWMSKNPVGTGPFQLARWQRDTKAVFKRFDGYWQKGKPYLDQLEWVFISDATTMANALKNKEIDLMITLAPKDIQDLRSLGYSATSTMAGSGAHSLVPDSANPNSPFAKIKVRQAVKHAIDVDSITKIIQYGANEPATQWNHKGHWGHNTSVKGYPYNPARAKQLLAEAGYPQGFRTKLTYAAGPDYDPVAVAIQGYLQAVGIELTLDPLQIARFNQISYQGGTWEGLIWAVGSANTDVISSLNRMYSGGGKYYTQLQLPDDYLAALNNGINASNFKKKAKFAQEIQKLIIDKHCMILPIYCPSMGAVRQPYVHDDGFFGAEVSSWAPENSWIGPEKPIVQK
jgi:peptide/nickel transport system substrate-binding protein